MESKTMKFGYTLLYVEDVEKTVVFYESAFGLQRKLLHENGYGELDTGATTLGFVSREVVESNVVEYTRPDPNGPAPAVEIAFVTDDVAAAYEKAVKTGAAAVAPPKEKPWGQTVAYVRDLNGFLVELCTAVPG
jgi:uncharacterized glyoxalase superfamily protein PhnB